jgi:hypothetical protein
MRNIIAQRKPTHGVLSIVSPFSDSGAPHRTTPSGTAEA